MRFVLIHSKSIRTITDEYHFREIRESRILCFVRTYYICRSLLISFFFFFNSTFPFLSTYLPTKIEYTSRLARKHSRATAVYRLACPHSTLILFYIVRVYQCVFMRSVLSQNYGPVGKQTRVFFVCTAMIVMLFYARVRHRRNNGIPFSEQATRARFPPLRPKFLRDMISHIFFTCREIIRIFST